ncbi:MAG: hypothetical protein ACPLUL_10020 [Thermanaerothrix sp.]|uniref:hypothetical protein n=1 Tax=Thermanaerothrix sp. TaxID=2972675 RepID=UPI003C7C6130
MRRRTIRDESKTIPLQEWPLQELPVLPWAFLGGLLVITLLVVVLAFLGGGG